MSDRDDLMPHPLEPRRPAGAPAFLCPSCDCQLHYEGSHPTDKSDAAADLSDYYKCPAGCGTFEYERHRHRLRLLEPGFSPDHPASEQVDGGSKPRP